MPDGEVWDGFGSIPEELLQAAANLILGPGLLADVFVIVARAVNAGFEPPDIFGSAELTVDGVSLGVWNLPRGANEDSYSPGWAGVDWTGVPISPAVNLALRISLTDEDLNFDDFAGAVTLDTDDLIYASEQGGATAILTDDQGAGAILVVVVTVSRE
jgi:hypothetical protein